VNQHRVHGSRAAVRGGARRWSMLATTALASSATAIFALHLLRPVLHPVRRRLSEYAIGPYGAAMTAAFVLFGGCLYGLSRAVHATGERSRAVRGIRALLLVAAAGMVLAGVFRTETGPSPGWGEIVHSRASALGFVALIGAAVLGATGARDTLAWGRSRRAADTLTALAVVCAALSPVTHDGPWNGLVQRLSYAALAGWLLLLARAVARTQQPE